MSLTSRVVAVNDVPRGEGVGYGWRFRARSRRTIAVVPMGYADGLDPRLSGRGHVLIRGRRAPIVGAISMDVMTVDATGIEGAQPGDEVVILGGEGNAAGQEIHAGDIANAIGATPWEIVSRIGSRVERIYLSPEAAASDRETGALSRC
jgi:alanine racemase